MDERSQAASSGGEQSVPVPVEAAALRHGLAPSDLVVIDGLPIGATLTAGACKGGYSWTLRPDELPGLALVLPVHDGKAHVLDVCVLAPDADDHGLSKPKTQFQLTVVATPHHSDAGTAPGEADWAWPELPPELGDDVKRLGLIEAYLTEVQARWQAAAAQQIAVAEARIKTKYQEQMAAYEHWLETDETTHQAETEARWRRELERQVAEIEAHLTARHRDHVATVEARWRAKQATRRVPEAEAIYRSDAERRIAAAEAKLTARSEAQLTAAEARHRAEMAQRIAEVEARLTAEHQQRLAAARAEWSAAEAANLAAAKAAWKAGYERQLNGTVAQMAAHLTQELLGGDARQGVETTGAAVDGPSLRPTRSETATA